MLRLITSRLRCCAHAPLHECNPVPQRQRNALRLRPYPDVPPEAVCSIGFLLNADIDQSVFAEHAHRVQVGGEEAAVDGILEGGDRRQTSGVGLLDNVLEK
mmetsp:Transcript_11130/g.15846  ORF Transcript_11130/g.15846 Transcript_11130/m.15846 type:complete len:101 (+) Transcript_11130:3-305(+)